MVSVNACTLKNLFVLTDHTLQGFYYILNQGVSIREQVGRD